MQQTVVDQSFVLVEPNKQQSSIVCEWYIYVGLINLTFVVDILVVVTNFLLNKTVKANGVERFEKCTTNALLIEYCKKI